MNDDLRGLGKVRVISAAGELLGVLRVEDALEMARGEGLDLVEVDADARPPLCKIIDLSGFNYEARKRERR